MGVCGSAEDSKSTVDKKYTEKAEREYEKHKAEYLNQKKLNKEERNKRDSQNLYNSQPFSAGLPPAGARQNHPPSANTPGYLINRPDNSSFQQPEEFKNKRKRPIIKSPVLSRIGEPGASDHKFSKPKRDGPNDYGFDSNKHDLSLNKRANGPGIENLDDSKSIMDSCFVPNAGPGGAAQRPAAHFSNLDFSKKGRNGNIKPRNGRLDAIAEEDGPPGERKLYDSIFEAGDKIKVKRKPDMIQPTIRSEQDF